MAGGRRASSSVGCLTRRRAGAAGRRGDDGSVPLSRRAGARIGERHRSDLGGVEEARGCGGRRGRTAVGGGRRWGEGGVGEEVGGGGAAGVGVVMGNGDGSEVGWALDVSLGNRRRVWFSCRVLRSTKSKGLRRSNVLEYVNRPRQHLYRKLARYPKLD
jgi:hypothetical protein